MRTPSVSRGACQGLLPVAAQPTGPMTPRRRGRVVRFRAGSIRTRSGTPGRPQSGHPETFCDGAVPVCRTMRVRFGWPPRRTAGLVESLFEPVEDGRPRQPRAGLSDTVPTPGEDCGSDPVSRFRRTLRLRVVSGRGGVEGSQTRALHAAGNGARRISPGMRERAISGRSSSRPAVRAAVRPCRNCYRKVVFRRGGACCG